MAGREFESSDPQKVIDWDCQEDVEAAVRMDGNNLKHASQRLKDNVNVVAIAGRQNPEAVKYASERVRNSEELKIRLNATDKDLNNENYQEEKEKNIKRNIEIKKSKSKGAERTLEKEDSSGWY